ncbi:MAG: hypothetical protein KGL39_14335 [Patescibacteria group bacterium]|nr:hypothetical protein [Patescibacteria group bacterium]
MKTLEQLIKECGSKAAAARKLGTDWQNIHDWATGKRIPNRAWHKFAQKMGVILPNKI